jgi:uncharacterized protein
MNDLALPPALQNLLVDPGPEPGLDPALAAAWSEHAARVLNEAPGAVVEDGGETIYTGGLSPGCQACKAGSWDCLFLTPRCNLTCAFCLSPSLHMQSVPLSEFGRDADEVVASFRLARPDGISISGGEVFLEFERLRALVARLRGAFPGAYLWAYTNGLLAGADQLAELGRLGLDEIRFNLAASGYASPVVLQRVEAAARSLPTVTVEIPAIPADAERLLAALPEWSEAGVRFLNLHELMYEPGSRSADLPGPRVEVRTPDGHVTAIHPHSRALTLRVMQAVQAQGLPLAVNDCSLHNKLRQVRGRRALVGRLLERLPGATETLGADGSLHTLCGFSVMGEVRFFHPHSLAAARAAHPTWRFAHLRRLPPLSPRAQTPWEFLEELAQ